MAGYKQHCVDCVKQLGKDWAVVHRWLDEFARLYKTPLGIWKGHRIHRHHKEGVEEVRAKWGDEAAEAAKVHILRDEDDIPTKAEIEKRYKV